MGHSTPHFNETHIKRCFFNLQLRLKSDGNNDVVWGTFWHSRGNIIPEPPWQRSPRDPWLGWIMHTDRPWISWMHQGGFRLWPDLQTPQIPVQLGSHGAHQRVKWWAFSNHEWHVREMKEITGQNVKSPNFKLLITQSWSCLYVQPPKSPWSRLMTWRYSVSVNPVVWRGDLPRITPSLDV